MRNRQGNPSPLIYYLHAANLAHMQAITAAAPDKTNPPWLPEFADQADELQKQITAFDLADASASRLKLMLDGIEAWRTHPYEHKSLALDVVWSNGTAKLIEIAPANTGRPVLVMPSLINRNYILHLTQEQSFLNRMAKHGLRPFLLDWGDLTRETRAYNVDAYCRNVMHPAFETLREKTDAPLSVLGYCMGGTMAVSLAAHPERKVHKLGLIGAPWDFLKIDGVAKVLRDQTHQLSVEKTRQTLRAMHHHFGEFPGDIFQYLFAVLAPMQVVQKFTKFAKMDPTSPQAYHFAAVEDWLADRQPVSSNVAETLLIDWYIENKTATLNWEPFGTPVNPANITCPTLAICGAKDHIVPIEMTRPLIDAIPNASIASVDAGHVGMIVGKHSHTQVADRLCSFFTA